MYDADDDDDDETRLESSFEVFLHCLLECGSHSRAYVSFATISDCRRPEFQWLLSRRSWPAGSPRCGSTWVLNSSAVSFLVLEQPGALQELWCHRKPKQWNRMLSTPTSPWLCRVLQEPFDNIVILGTGHDVVAWLVEREQMPETNT